MNSQELILQDRHKLLDLVIEKASHYDFESYIIGISRPKDYDRNVHEQAFRQLKIEIGTELEKLWPDRVVDFEDFRIWKANFAGAAGRFTARRRLRCSGITSRVWADSPIT